MSSLRRAIGKTAIRMDDPKVTEELACQRERANWLATRSGLPGIGSKMLNEYGIEWIVQEHVALPTCDSLHRWREGEILPAQDLYPVIFPTSFSPRLTDFLLTVDRCTTKTFAFVDTMPGRRRDSQVPGGNHIDTICHPTANIVFLDAARVHETIIAHELGHAWVQYVDECEDLRVMRDADDPQRLRLLSFVQSFVLDLKVNELIWRKGFDMAPIEADHHASVVQLAEFLSNGGKTDLPREEVVWAMSIAERLLVEECTHGAELAQLDAALPAIRTHAPSVMALAETLAAAVRYHGYASREAIIASIDECLGATFEHCGDSIDIEHDLVEVQSEEPNLDKWPAWIDGASVTLKTTVGKVMAREGIPSSARWSLSDRGHQTLLQFILDNGEHTEGWLLDIPFPFRDPLASVRMHMENQRRQTERLERQLAEVDRINRENRERQEQILRHASVHLPTMPSMPSLPVATVPSPISKQVGLRPNGLGIPPGKQVPELLPRNRSGSTPLAFANVERLPLPTKARNYMAGLARFLTAARLQELLAGEHPYAYVENNPITYVDPRGLQAIRPKPHLLPPHGGGIGGGYDYGSYCGSANKRNPWWRVLPQDCVDACCMQHDRCLEAHYGAGFGGVSAHGCCDYHLSNCVQSLDYSCCNSSPTPLGCLWAIKTIREMFGRLGKNPIRPNCLPPNEWGRYCRINWGGTGPCQDISLPRTAPPSIQGPANPKCGPQPMVPGPVVPGMPIPKPGGGFGPWQ